MKRELVLIPKIKIHPSKIITYSEIHWTPSKPRKSISSNQNTVLIQVEVNGKIELKRVSTNFLNSSRQGNGQLSPAAKKRLKLAIEYFLLLNKPVNGKSGNTGRHFDKKITFITLTLPSKQIHTDNEIKAKCLNQFLIEISKYHNVSNYVWRAEYQKNGNIHFHILVNKYIFWNDVRNRWNRIINKIGYVDRYREELKKYHKDGFQVRTDLLKQWDIKAQYKAYLKGVKHDWNSPNSIDIHEIRNITNIQAYCAKYLTKATQENQNQLKDNTEKPKEIGRSWGASIVISNIQGATTDIDSNISDNLIMIERLFPEAVFKSEYFTVIDINIEMLSSLKMNDLTDLFYRYLFEQFHYSTQLSF